MAYYIHFIHTRYGFGLLFIIIIFKPPIVLLIKVYHVYMLIVRITSTINIPANC